MSLTRKVAYNTILQAGGKIFGTVIGFAIATIVFNYLSEDNNVYTTILAYLQLFGIVMDLGLYVVLLKHIANDDAQHSYTNTLITLRFVTALVVLAIACSTVWLIQAPAYTTTVKWGVLIVSANYFFITLNQLLMAVYQHHLATQRVALAEIIGKIVLLLSTLLVVYVFQAGVYAILLTIVLSGGINFILLWQGLRHYSPVKLIVDWSRWGKILRESWPIAIAIALNLIYFKADTIILSFYWPNLVGIYGFPYKILEVIITVPAIIVGLIMPKLSAVYAEHNLVRFKELYQRSFYALSLLAMPMVVGAMVIAHPLMNLIVTDEKLRVHLVDLGNLLQILMLAMGVIFLGTLTGYVIVIVNRQRQIIWGYAFVAITALTAYLWLIPKYSYYGAAWITVYSEGMMALINMVLIYHVTKVLPSLHDTWRVALASIIMGGAVLVAVQFLPVVLVIPFGGIVYGIALIVVRGISKADLKLLLNRQSTNS